MSEQLQLRRGTAAQVGAFPGAAGETVLHTTNHPPRLHDGPPPRPPSLAPALAAVAQGANGANIQLGVLETLVSGLTGASVNAPVQIPANCIVLSVGARVVTTITGPTSYEVGVSGNLTQFGSGLALPAGSTNYGLIGPAAFYVAPTLTLTAIGGNFT